MDIRNALQHYLCQLDADGRSIHTRKQSARHVALLEACLSPRTDVHHITPTDVAGFLASDAATRRADGARKKASSMNRLRSSIVRFFRFLLAAGYIEEDPSRLVRRAREASPPPRGFSEAERTRLFAELEGAPLRDRVLIRTLLGTGIRVGSAVGLDVEDVDLEEGNLRLRNTKGGGEDLLPLASGVIEILAELLADRASGPLFTTRSGNRISVRHAQRIFASYAKGAGLRATGTHSARHTFALEIYRKTGDLIIVQRALGHRAIASTVVYMRADDQRLRNVLNN